MRATILRLLKPVKNNSSAKSPVKQYGKTHNHSEHLVHTNTELRNAKCRRLALTEASSFQSGEQGSDLFLVAILCGALRTITAQA